MLLFWVECEAHPLGHLREADSAALQHVVDDGLRHVHDMAEQLVESAGVDARHHLSVLFITHDLSVARRMSDRVMVMQEGEIKGIGTPEEVFSESADPYIRALSNAVFTFRGKV